MRISLKVSLTRCSVIILPNNSPQMFSFNCSISGKEINLKTGFFPINFLLQTFKLIRIIDTRRSQLWGVIDCVKSVVTSWSQLKKTWKTSGYLYLFPTQGMIQWSSYIYHLIFLWPTAYFSWLLSWGLVYENVHFSFYSVWINHL
jgi:hypothetical protein